MAIRGFTLGSPHPAVPCRERSAEADLVFHTRSLFSHSGKITVAYWGVMKALEAEFVPITGTGEVSSSDLQGTYTFFGLIVAPVLRFPLSQSSRTALFISPGVGFGSVKVDLDNSDLFAEDTSFVFQVKAGFEVEMLKNWSILLQGRYLNTSAGDTFIGNENIEAWSPKIGIRFWF